MNSLAERPLDGRQALVRILAAWRPLLVYELATSIFSALVLGPLVLVVSSALIGLSGEDVLVNWEMVSFFLSPRGLVAALLGASLTLGLLFVEYSGLLLIADAALCGVALSPREIMVWVVKAAPRLLGLAMLQTGAAIIVALPFLGLGFLVYWTLLSAHDLNFYWAERPPRFWVACSLGGVLALTAGSCLAWIFTRWAFALPLCTLAGEGGLAALPASHRLVRGRAKRLLMVFVSLRLLELGALFVTAAGLDWGNRFLFARLGQEHAAILWSTLLALVLDASLLELVTVLFAIATAAWIAYQYEIARRSRASLPSPFVAGMRPARMPGPAWRSRATIIAVVILAPAVTACYAVLLKYEHLESRPTSVTAHRAGPKPAPENSIAALRRAIAARADFVEIDVQQTADEHVVLLHDRDLRRVTGDSRQLSEMRLADLAALRLLAADGATDETIPTLRDFLVTVDGQLRINIELKDFGDSIQLAQAVLDLLRELKMMDRAIVSSFDLAPLAELRRRQPGLPVGAILSAATGDPTRLPVDFLSLNHRLVTASLVRNAHRRGLEVHAWTVNDENVALRMLDLGCDNLITSDLARMREIVDWYAGLNDVERMLLRLRRWLRE